MPRKKTAPVEVAVEEPQEEVAAEQYVRVSRRVDKHNTYRSVKKVTPSTCTVCGFNTVQANEDGEIPAWDEMGLDEQNVALAMLRRHGQKVHPDVRHESALVDPSTLNRSWLPRPRPI